MFAIAETRFEIVGDEYIFAEISREMSAKSAFKAIVITHELRKRNIPGIIDISPSNASYLVRFNPELLSAHDLLDYLKEIDVTKSNPAELHYPMRIIEIPTWYNDPITQQHASKYKERHQNHGLSNFEFVMKANGFKDEQSFIEAHSRYPYLISMIGYIPGLGWEFPLGPRDSIIEVPKYASPRGDTPKQAVGIGGAFTVVYPSACPGSYQLIGITPVPVYNQLSTFSHDLTLARAGDIWVHRPIDEGEYSRILQMVDEKSYTYHIKELEFSCAEYFRNESEYVTTIRKELF